MIVFVWIYCMNLYYRHFRCLKNLMNLFGWSLPLSHCHWDAPVCWEMIMMFLFSHVEVSSRFWKWSVPSSNLTSFAGQPSSPWAPKKHYGVSSGCYLLGSRLSIHPISIAIHQGIGWKNQLALLFHWRKIQPQCFLWCLWRVAAWREVLK